MIALVIQYEADGTIAYAGVQDVQNVDAYATDGYWIAADGRPRPTAPNTCIFELGYPWIADLLQTWRDKKYYVALDDQQVITIYEDSAWVAPTILKTEPEPIYEDTDPL